MGATFEKIMKIGRKKCFRRWWVKAANMPPKSKKTSADLSLAIILVVFRVASHK